MGKYEFVQENLIEGYILDTEKNRIIAICHSKRPDRSFDDLKELIELANKEK